MIHPIPHPLCFSPSTLKTTTPVPKTLFLTFQLRYHALGLSLPWIYHLLVMTVKHPMFDHPLLCFQPAVSNSSLTITLQSLHVIQATELISEEISFLPSRANPPTSSLTSLTWCLHASLLPLHYQSSPLSWITPAAFRPALLYFLGLASSHNWGLSSFSLFGKALLDFPITIALTPFIVTPAPITLFSV